MSDANVKHIVFKVIHVGAGNYFFLMVRCGTRLSAVPLENPMCRVAFALLTMMPSFAACQANFSPPRASEASMSFLIRRLL